MKYRLLAAATMTAALMTAPAGAAIIITTDQGSVQTDENVLSNTDMTGTTVFGNTNQTNTSVSFMSLNGEQLSTQQSNGQARFVAVDGSLDTFSIMLTNGGTFETALFNLFQPTNNTDSVTISVNGGAGQVFDLDGNGENFFGVVATDGDVINSITINTNGDGIRGLRQVRLGGLGDGGMAPIPEPATWAMMIGGFGLIGAASRRRRRTSVTFA